MPKTVFYSVDRTASENTGDGLGIRIFSKPEVLELTAITREDIASYYFSSKPDRAVYLPPVDRPYYGVYIKTLSNICKTYPHAGVFYPVNGNRAKASQIDALHTTAARLKLKIKATTIGDGDYIVVILTSPPAAQDFPVNDAVQVETIDDAAAYLVSSPQDRPNLPIYGEQIEPRKFMQKLVEMIEENSILAALRPCLQHAETGVVDDCDDCCDAEAPEHPDDLVGLVYPVLKATNTNALRVSMYQVADRAGIYVRTRKWGNDIAVIYGGKK